MREIGYYVSNNDASHAYVSFGEAEIYQKSIEKVCNKLGFDSSEVKWMIYDPKDPPHTSIFESVIKLNKFWTSYVNAPVEKYYYNVQMKKIYISNKSLLCTLSHYKEISDISLIDNLLINAITRLQTKTTEDNEAFMEKLQENYNKFLPVGLSQMLSY